jgi:hypothetical protein
MRQYYEISSDGPCVRSFHEILKNLDDSSRKIDDSITVFLYELNRIPAVNMTRCIGLRVMAAPPSKVFTLQSRSRAETALSNSLPAPDERERKFP